MNEITLYCGIDVSCDTLDACYQSTDLSLHHCKVSNDAKGCKELLKQTSNTHHFVIEATGVYQFNVLFK